MPLFLNPPKPPAPTPTTTPIRHLSTEDGGEGSDHQHAHHPHDEGEDGGQEEAPPLPLLQALVIPHGVKAPFRHDVDVEAHPRLASAWLTLLPSLPHAPQVRWDPRTASARVNAQETKHNNVFLFSFYFVSV